MNKLIAITKANWTPQKSQPPKRWRRKRKIKIEKNKSHLQQIMVILQQALVLESRLIISNRIRRIHLHVAPFDLPRHLSRTLEIEPKRKLEKRDKEREAATQDEDGRKP
jgi:hypothetical protein